MADTSGTEEVVPEYNPLRDNKETLQKLDKLLPEFTSVTQELRLFREMLGNGAMDWWPNGKMVICL